MDKIFTKIWENKFVFLGTFFLVFTLSYIVLLAVDFLPEPVIEDSTVNTEQPMAEEVTTNITESSDSIAEVVANQSQPEVLEVGGASEVSYVASPAEFPLSITIEKLGKIISVANPTSRAIADLDTALLDGVVRHPDSATLNQEGNVFILGHSSYLPKVFNHNFQAFNGIQNLEWGDKIEVASENAVYEYRVEKVYRAKAQDVTVPIAGTENLLTLATCNSFGSTDDRYIVEAKRIGVRSL